MKVLIATGLYPPDIGGPATYTVLLERELPRQGTEVVTVPFGRFRSLPKGLRHIAYFFSVFRHARGTKLIYALDPVSVGLPALLASVLLKKPFVLRVAGDYAWEQAELRYSVRDTLEAFNAHTDKYPSKIKRLISVERFVARRAKHVVVPSEYLKRIVTMWGADEDTITVIYNAFSAVDVAETKEALRSQQGYSGYLIVSAGRLVPWKGFRALLDIVPSLKEQIGEVTVVIAGDGPQRAELEAHTKELGIESNVRFVGRLEKEELARTIKAADVFVLNTGYEGLSHQLLEVMSLGVPIVTTHIGGNREIIEHEKEGLLVSFNDRTELGAAVQRVLTDEKLRASLTTAAHTKAQHFTANRMIHELTAFLRSFNIS